MSIEIVSVIKPEAMWAREEILRRIKILSVEIRKTAVKRLSRGLLAQVYKNAPPEIQEEIFKQMEAPVEIIFIRGGETLIQDMLRLTGLARSPAECPKGTIRHDFGIHEPVKLPDGQVYFKNGIHRPRDTFEASRDLKLFTEEIEEMEIVGCS